MKFTFSWLCDHLNTDKSLDEICDALPMLGLEVEKLHNPLAALVPFRVVEIVKANPHPDADRLKVCCVNTGKDELQIVCGAPNARAGLRTVLAPVGTYVPGSDLVIKQGKIRGQKSQGMLCSLSELNLGEEHEGITELPSDAPVGASFADFAQKEYAGLVDPVIEIAITPNRGDCLGVRGVARDLAAAGFGTLKDIDFSSAEGEFESPLTWQIDKEVSSLVPLISGRLFEGVSNGSAPAWMAQRLTAVGQRPISALVDITNYVMIDLGRPLHAYDADRVAGDKLTLRFARAGEQVLALNEKTYHCGPDMLVISDADGPDDLAGIMGGERTGVSETTTRMFLEIAIFDPINVASTGRQLNIHSDARYRFERGLDTSSPVQMAGYIARMVQSICGGRFSQLVVNGIEDIQPQIVAFPPNRTKALTGIACPDDRQERILTDLGFRVDRSQPDRWKVAIPSWRNDIDGPADLVEEVIRIHGYDNLETAALPRDSYIARPAFSPVQLRPLLVRRLLAGRGLTEAVTFSFLRPEEARMFGGGDEALGVANPISTELSMMRPSLLPNLLLAAGRNLNRAISDIGLFEVGPVFIDTSETGQRTAVGGIRVGAVQVKDWQDAGRTADLFDAKSDLFAVLDCLGVRTQNLIVSTDVPDWMHPGRSGQFMLGKTAMGCFGELHPRICVDYGLPAGVVGFELWLNNIPMPRQKGPAKPLLKLSTFQPVTRDFAFIVEETVAAQSIIDAVRRAARDVVTDISVFDVYQGKGIDDGRKSVALAITLQPRDATFSENDLIALSEQIIATVEKNCGGVLRGA